MGELELLPRPALAQGKLRGETKPAPQFPLAAAPDSPVPGRSSPLPGSGMVLSLDRCGCSHHPKRGLLELGAAPAGTQ